MMATRESLKLSDCFISGKNESEGAKIPVDAPKIWGWGILESGEETMKSSTKDQMTRAGAPNTKVIPQIIFLPTLMYNYYTICRGSQGGHGGRLKSVRLRFDSSPRHNGGTLTWINLLASEMRL